MVVFIQRKVKEPARWVEMKALGHRVTLGYGALFSHRTWRRNAIAGMLLACAGVIGLWGIGFFSIDLQRSVLEKTFRSERLSGSALKGALLKWSGYASMMINVGAFCGMFLFSRVAQRIGRRATFAIALLSACASTAFVFWNLKTRADIFWMLPLMGFCQLALFAGYAIYFPELFPTRLRSTGTSFCYNVGRFIAAAGHSCWELASETFADKPEPLRYAGLTMCSIFLIGLLVLPFAPETKGQPLPEDDSACRHIKERALAPLLPTYSVRVGGHSFAGDFPIENQGKCVRAGGAGHLL